MKKILSMILSLSMILAIAATMGLTVAAAPEGTAIKSAADFAAMAADGKYYLANDITIEATYEARFLGTIDGNGKTVTVKVPMFHTFSGAIKNLNIKGEVTTAYGSTQSSDTNATIYPWGDIGIGAIAAFVIADEGKTVTFDNIVSDAKVSCDHKETTYTNKEGEAKADRAAAGALYGVGNGNITVTNCVNNGEITGMDQVGGLVGWADRSATSTFTMTGCVNNGIVNATNNYGGGLVGRPSEGANIFTDCVNNGTMNCYNSQAGGIFGYANPSLETVIKNCLNTGTIQDIDTTDDKFINIGGIFGALTPKVDGNKLVIENCTNTADIAYAVASSKYAGGMFGLVTASSRKDLAIEIKNCVNTGDISNVTNAGGIIGRIHTESKKAASGTLLVSGCVNTGNISGSNRTAGIVAESGTSAAYAIATIENCVNLGDITGKQVGGICSYAYGSGSVSYVIMSGCANYGTLTASTWNSQLLCYSNNNNMQVVNNLAAGKITGTDDAHALVIGLSSADITQYTISGNYYIENDGTKTYSHADSDSNAKNRVALADMPAGAVITCTEAQLASGEVATALNTALGATVFAVEGGKTVITCDHEYLFVDGKCSACGYSEPVVVPPVDEPSKPTGDNAWVYVLVAAIAVLGTAVVAKRREN